MTSKFAAGARPDKTVHVSALVRVRVRMLVCFCERMRVQSRTAICVSKKDSRLLLFEQDVAIRGWQYTLTRSVTLNLPILR